MTDEVINEPPASDEPTPAEEGEPKESSGNDELKAFMEEYRADKLAAKEKAEADALAAAEAEVKKKKVPAPEPKKKTPPKPAEPPVKEEPKERAYGSARWFNRKPKKVKE